METEPYVDLREVSWTGEVLTNAEAYAHLAIDELSHLADEVRSNLVAARSALEREHGVLLREVVNMTYTLDDWPDVGDPFYLPVSPVQSITSVVYTDEADSPQTLASNLYRFRKPTCGRPSILITSALPLPRRKADSVVTITLVAGWGVGKVPAIGKQAVRLLLTELFDESEDVRQRDFNRNRAYQLMQNLNAGVLY